MKSKGFTLIELMITVVIIAVLAAIAIPAYQRHVEKTRRADAITGLTNVAQQLERCFTRTNTYQNCVNNPATPDGFYNLNAQITATTYLLTATPTGLQASDVCTQFTLDHMGNRAALPPGESCWGSN